MMIRIGERIVSVPRAEVMVARIHMATNDMVFTA